MKKFFWLNIKFENLVKFVILICTIIAITIICVAFYYVFSKSKKEENEFCIDNLISISGFEASYDVTIYSNINVNKYNVLERADFMSDSYNIKVDDGIEINSNGNKAVIDYDGANTSYSYCLEENTLNVISLSYIIKNINSDYEKRENDLDYIYSVKIDNELFNYYEIYVSKLESKINKICIYNHEGIVQIITDCINIEVKK